MSAAFLVASAFLASAVEMVEALTIVLAAGLARGWRSALTGVGAAVVALAAIVGALGPALTVVPLSALRLVVGALLLIFGLQWLRKAILRASGHKALHDEDAIFARELADAERAARVERAGVDGYGFTVAFKGVLLEGLEVAFIVLTFGSTQGSIPLAAVGAAAAVVLVTGVGLAVRAPLARVPEEVRRRRDADDLRDLLGRRGRGRPLARRGRRAARRARLRLPLVARPRRAAAPAAAERPGRARGRGVSRLAAFGRFWWDFVVGDDWLSAAGVAVGLGATAALAGDGVAAWWLLPLAVLLVLWLSLRRAVR
jgi:uncharacterized membrane protein